MSTELTSTDSWVKFILNTRKPLILKNHRHRWKCFERNLHSWCQLWDDARQREPLKVSAMDLHSVTTPQWERKQHTILMQSIDILQNNSDYWYACNYQPLRDLPSQCSQGIDFKRFGFSHLPNDGTFWLCSKGANTPCHYDTYGCNVVTQIYGRKSWLLFPPETPLTCTRIPYEESSVYCLENFFSPSPNEIPKLIELKDYAYYVVLEPNDVLIVPYQWWHYVEAMDHCLSVNTWIPLKIDIEQRISECIVKYLMENFIRNASQTVRDYILNPNQLQEIISEDELFAILEILLKQQQDAAKNNKLTHLYEYQTLSEEEISNLIQENSKNVEYVQNLSLNNYKKLLENNGKRYLSKDTANKKRKYHNIEKIDIGENQRSYYDEKATNKDKVINNEQKINPIECKNIRSNNEKLSPLNILQEQLINSICSPVVINAIKAEFLKRTN